MDVEQRARTRRRDSRGFRASPGDTIVTNATSGLVLHLSAYCDDMGCARRAKCVLHTFRDARVIAKQNAGEERRLRFGEDLRNDVLGARLERVQPSERCKALFARSSPARLPEIW